LHEKPFIVDLEKVKHLDDDNVGRSMNIIDTKFTLRACFRVYAIYQSREMFVMYIKLMQKKFDEVGI